MKRILFYLHNVNKYYVCGGDVTMIRTLNIIAIILNLLVVMRVVYKMCSEK